MEAVKGKALIKVDEVSTQEVGWGEEVEGDAGSKPLYSRDLSSLSSGPRRVSRAPGSFVDNGERERRLSKQETRGEERERGR